MDITTFIQSRREILQIGDYSTYRAQLSRQILGLRKRLGRATPKREKFSPKPITTEDIGRNHEFAHLLLLQAERAWAHAMHVKTSHSEDAGGITGSTRSHIISRLSKAAKTAAELVDSLKDTATSKATGEDVLESRAYLASLAGGEQFEKLSEGQRSSDGQASEKRWQSCLKLYAEARVIYAAFYEKLRKEVHREVLANTVDPTIRYAAYQAHISRTIAIETVAKRYFPKEDQDLVKAVERLDTYALKDKPKADKEEDRVSSPQDVPNSISWRGRKANIVDASIGQALASVSLAEKKLASHLSANADATSRAKAAAFDEILIASQDAVDATKRSLDELEKERVDEGDPRMQDLRVTSLAVNYDLVSWRVGRNRILIGDDYGMTFEPQVQKKPKRLRKDGKEHPDKEEGRGRKLARLRERVVLYDATLQSIESVKSLPGAMRDAKFVEELDNKTFFFRALKCLNISYSHSLLGNHLNALALIQRARELSSVEIPTAQSDSSVPSLEISPLASEALKNHTSALLNRTHALVEMHKLETNATVAAKKNMTSAAPLVEDLYAYPTPGVQVDCKKLVQYPPKIEAVPVKPMFLDVAWNYIDYPGRKAAEVQAPTSATKEVEMADVAQEEQPKQEKKKGGWFSFGRG
ncbi:hypothetical protein MBLNU230_g5166t1 [Neophaeotheca triangularis]